MPLAVIHMETGALDDVRLGEAVAAITDLYLDAQRAPKNSVAARRIARVEVVEMPRRRIYLGGVPLDGPSLYRVEFVTPQGSLDDEARARLVSGATDILLRADGADLDNEAERHRVWCIVTEVGEGRWACAGRIFTWAEIKRWVLKLEVALRRKARQVAPPAADPVRIDEAA